eukprot:g26530.t1
MPNFLNRLRNKGHCCAFLTVTFTEKSPGQVVGYRHSEELDALHSLKLSSVDADGGVFSYFLPEVNDQFFSFPDIETHQGHSKLQQVLSVISQFDLYCCIRLVTSPRRISKTSFIMKQ